MDLSFPNVLIGGVLALIAAAVIRGWLVSRTPEARARAAEKEAERNRAVAALPSGWTLTTPDRERYGAGKEGLDAYGVVAVGPNGERVIGIALSEADAYRTALRGLQGELDRSDAWAPSIPPLAGPAKDLSHAPDDVTLPSGWTMVSVDLESYYTDGQSVDTYGGLAVGPGGERALAVTLDKSLAVPRLIDVIEGRLQVSDGWAFHL